MAKPEYINQTLLEGLQVLDYFIARLHPFDEISINQLKDELGMDYHKTNRMVKTLEHAGYLETDPAGKRYKLSRKLTQITWRYLNRIREEHQRLQAELASFDLTPLENLHVEESHSAGEPAGQS